jgi:energy-coupling factor transport system ATP-binding protein
LDPIAAAELLAAIGKINRELGVTVIMTEHRLEQVFPLSDRVLVMDKGHIICDDTPQNVGMQLKERQHSMFFCPAGSYAHLCRGGKQSVVVRLR